MNTDTERWVDVLDSIAHLRTVALIALSDLRQNEDRQDPDWRALWGFYQNELLELRDCEVDAQAALSGIHPPS